jgi:2,3,4,5-tetrahydropyridine-2-carboxylate N-succinyltransferase
MPSYVNIGAYVDEETMVDTWATLGSCAQIGKMYIFQVVLELAEC